MPATVIALDPGATTGWAGTAYLGPPFVAGQLKQNEVWAFLERHQPGLLVVERFVYRRMPKVVLTPVEIIGLTKEWARQRSVSIIWQTPSQVKFYWTDMRLKEQGVYQRGKPHANDALRHLLYYLEFGEGRPSQGGPIPR